MVISTLLPVAFLYFAAAEASTSYYIKTSKYTLCTEKSLQYFRHICSNLLKLFKKNIDSLFSGHSAYVHSNYYCYWFTTSIDLLKYHCHMSCTKVNCDLG